MRDILKTILVGQVLMLVSIRDMALVCFLVAGSIGSIVFGIILRDLQFMSAGVSLAVIDLTVAYLMGRREQRR